ncbi:aminotransferase class IV [Burkholderia multivorans]|uniref:aminotransferase class IV n=2 Tax=Burkholderia multivorans TaxID=87883 RepID=UPI0021C01EB1|nr:aminotransferase class IV [Burkholderia multivorans]
MSSLAMRYGLSVFEGMRAYLTHDSRLQPFRMAAHLERLRQSARTLTLPDLGIDRIPEIVEHLAEVNGVREDCYIRPSIHAIDPGDMGSTLASALTVDVKPMGRRNGLPRISRRRSRSRADARRGSMCFRRRAEVHLDMPTADIVLSLRLPAGTDPAIVSTFKQGLADLVTIVLTQAPFYEAMIKRADDLATAIAGLSEPAVTLIAERIQRQKSIRAILARGDWLTARQINLLQAAPPSNEVQPTSEWKRLTDHQGDPQCAGSSR